MTTGWGTTWPAPGMAYEFTAALADGDAAAADALWKELDHRGRTDLILALGAQTRLVAAYHGDEGAAGRIRALQVLDLIAALQQGGVHQPAADYAVMALRGRTGPPPAADCPDRAACLRTAAAALVWVRLRTAGTMGFSPRMVAVICRRAARP